LGCPEVVCATVAVRVVAMGDGRGFRMVDGPVVERGVLTAPAQAWDVAVRQAGVIGRLAEKGTVGLEAADKAADELGVSRRQVYVLVGRWRAGEGVVSDLLPGRSSGGRGGGRLPAEVEAIVREVLRSRYLTRQRRTVVTFIGKWRGFFGGIWQGRMCRRFPRPGRRPHNPAHAVIHGVCFRRGQSGCVWRLF
jgi:hypothetical protein